MFIKIIISHILRLRLFEFFLILFFANKIKVIYNNKHDYNILLLDLDRFGDNINNLIEIKKFNFYYLGTKWQDRLNFLSEVNFKDSSNIKNKSDIASSEKGKKFLQKILLKILMNKNIDCVLTCGAYYNRNINWEKILKDSKIPLFCLHKESVGLSREINFLVNKSHYKNLRKFHGNLLFVSNHHMKDLLVSIDYFPKDQIHVVGLPKIDNLFNLKNAKNIINKINNRIVLFSFYHTYLLEEITATHGRWSNDGSFGFYNLFDSVHGTIAKFAKNNPSIEVVIKIKWKDDIWEKKIIESIERYKLNFQEIPNLKIDWKTDAQKLIFLSDTVVGFNSTTLTEALYMNKKIIIPIFEEAKNKYEKFVLWSNNESFIHAFSESELYSYLENSNNFIFKYNDNVKKTLEEAFGYIDGMNTSRLSHYISKFLI